MTAAVHVLQARTGWISGAYDTRAGERVWIIIWDDGRPSPPEDVEEDPALERGCRVRLAGGRLERVA